MDFVEASWALKKTTTAAGQVIYEWHDDGDGGNELAYEEAGALVSLWTS